MPIMPVIEDGDLKLISQKLDWWGLNYYKPDRVHAQERHLRCTAFLVLQAGEFRLGAQIGKHRPDTVVRTADRAVDAFMRLGCYEVDARVRDMARTESTPPR